MSIVERRLHDWKEMLVLNINRKNSSMMPAPYSADLRWRVIWFTHILQNSVAEASFFLGVCERTVERYISAFLVNGSVKPEPVSRSNGSISFAPREELFFFFFSIPNVETTVPFVKWYMKCFIYWTKFLLVVQFPFDNCNSPFSLTKFFEIGVYIQREMIS